jgi:cyclohexadienyl dehydratase
MGTLRSVVTWAVALSLCMAIGFGRPAPAAAHPEVSHLEKITQSQQLRVCIWPEYYAISHKNPQTGQLEGIDIDIAKELAQELNAELGDPYIVTSIFGVTTKDHPKIDSWSDIDQEGLVVAAQLGSYVDSFMKDYLKNAEVLSVQPPATREGEVAAGRADILMTDYPIAKKLESQHDWAQIIAPEEPLAVTPYAYVIAPGDQIWLNYINLFVETIKRDGRLLKYGKKNGLEPVVKLD